MVIMAKTYRYKSAEDTEKDAAKESAKANSKDKKQPDKKAADSKKGKEGGK